MAPLTTLFTFALIAYQTSASPIRAMSNTTQVEVPSVMGTVEQTSPRLPLSGPAALAAVYDKYRQPLSENQLKAARDMSTPAKRATVSANPENYDAAYLSPVTIGGQTLNLDFDTGSSDLWVFSSELSAAAQANHDIYNPAKSKTSKNVPGATWNITYAGGSSAYGDVYNDTVTVGGLAIPNQAVELASNVSKSFLSDADRDGTFGLGFPILNTIKPKQRTGYFFTAIQQKALALNVFTADLKKGKPGSYDFGNIDSTKYTGSITYTNVDSSQGHWAFTSSGYGVGSTFTTSQMNGVADTGSSLIMLPDAVVTAYYSKVSGASFNSAYGAYTFPCSTTLPAFIVGVGSARYTVPGTYMNYGPVSSTTCYGGLQSSKNIGINIFGNVFLKTVFAVFDASVPRIGFASKNL